MGKVRKGWHEAGGLKGRNHRLINRFVILRQSNASTSMHIVARHLEFLFSEALQVKLCILINPSSSCRVFVCCSRLASEKVQTIRQSLLSYISEALDHAPSLIIFDDLDSIILSTSDSEGFQPSTSMSAMSEFLTDMIDEYEVITLLWFPCSLARKANVLYYGFM